ncbi:FAD-dependent oxidoreductase [Gluconacetobacter tumulicola]|uniref:FAD-dependent oxidoreductase n=1 Tax=Gluconacetobacter tumulicola TaxID=1017177 RepID=A0A7W4JFF5_9PROT|nr:FAD-dependent oxidoreductase [Gluconacetobacter tumulicola]MBB2180062.1 FAD-dependent oxidoreductase [Gluconacetobacter tumulicola]
MRHARSVTVIGGGVVGLSTAYALIRQGHVVRLVEQLPDVGHGASFANGGQLSYRYVAPLADAGVPRQALAWMMRPGAPVSLRLRADRDQWRWLLSFLAACRAGTNRAHAHRLLDIALLAQRVLAAWRAEGLEEFCWRRPGKMIVHRTATTLAHAARGITQPDAQSVLTAAECVAREPALETLRGALAGGIFTEGEEVADCHLFCRALLARLAASPDFTHVRGVATLEAAPDNRCAVRIDGQAGPQTDLIVVAAGLRTRALLRAVGEDIPLYGLKGYSLTLPVRAGGTPDISVTDYDNRVVYARLGERFRIAAMVDIGADDDGASPRRIAQLRRLAQASFPNAGPYDDAEAWAGFRPATPTGLPVVGYTGRANLMVNAGQGALGFTLAPACATLLALLVGGETTGAPVP